MSTMLIANNCTRESGSFMGDQLCALKTAYLFVEHAPQDVDHIVMSVSPHNEMHFLWEKFIEKYNIELIYDDWNPGNWEQRWTAWDRWRAERRTNTTDGIVIDFKYFKECYLRIHGAIRQQLLCGSERGLARRNIYQYWYCGQEGNPDELPQSVDWFDDTLIYHPPLTHERDVWISPHAKTQGNYTFTFAYWEQVVRALLDAGVTVTVGFDGHFCEDLRGHSLYRKWWGTHREWMEELCRHKIVACGNTGTGWLAAACGVPMITMEPPNSQMPDHRYRQCGLRNIVEVLTVPDPDYCARRLVEEVKQKIVMTTGCYDILHAGHVKHLERSRAMGSKLIVALNSDDSVMRLKGTTRPINPQGQRKEVLEALRCVDEVRVFNGDNALSLLTEIKPAVITAGFGYTLDTIVGRTEVESWGGKAVITCTGDASNEPSTTKIQKRLVEIGPTIRAGIGPGDVIELCRAASAYSVNPFDKLKLMAEEFLSIVHLDGDVADLGAYRGGVSLILRRLAPNKHLHIFDTWAGTPYDDPLCHHKAGEWATDLEGCARLVGISQLTHYHKGMFPNSDHELFNPDEYPQRTYCFVYVDMDTEQATHCALDFFFPRMVRGGKILVDDYNWEPCAGVKKAVDEFDAPKRVVQSQYACIIEKQ